MQSKHNILNKIYNRISHLDENSSHINYYFYLFPYLKLFSIERDRNVTKEIK